MKAELVISMVGAATGLWALRLAVLSLRASSREARRGNLLQERMLALEIRREAVQTRQGNSARLIARLTPSVAGSHRSLVIKNLGQATAADIVLRMDGTPIREHPEHLRPDQEIPQLGPDAEFAYQLFITASSPTNARTVELTWTNADGTNGIHMTTIQP